MSSNFHNSNDWPALQINDRHARTEWCVVTIKDFNFKIDDMDVKNHDTDFKSHDLDIKIHDTDAKILDTYTQNR